MFKNIAKAISGDPIQKMLDHYREMVDEINALEPGLQALSDETLKAKTGEFKERLQQGETVDDLLVETFAVVREVAIRTVGLRHFDVQLVGACRRNRPPSRPDRRNEDRGRENPGGHDADIPQRLRRTGCSSGHR